MPESPGYLGKAQPELPVIRVTAVTHRKNPILQTLIGPAEEHTNLVGIPTEASILRLVEKSMPGRLAGVYCHPSGSGLHLAILRFKKLSLGDEGSQRQAALTAFMAFPRLKHVVIVDEDVDIFDTNDVLWAMTSRCRGAAGTVFLPAPDNTCKTIFDCTVPYGLKESFRRPEFLAVDLAKYGDF
jgi:4-hydroxy-3-polyprenylbenzoate decarboxylase